VSFLVIMWENMVQTDRPQMTKQYGAEKMKFACWINKARIYTNTYSEYVILIIISSTKYFVAQHQCKGSPYWYFQQ